MAKIILCILIFIFLAVLGVKHEYTNYRRGADDYEVLKCTSEIDQERGAIIERSKCLRPKDVYEVFPRKPHEQITPRAAWVKRCVGVCDYDVNSAGTCVATVVNDRNIPVRIYSLKTNKEYCATYPVIHHVTCGCISLGRRHGNETLQSSV